tara:strand:- start:34805 stop:34978 length:174 start_codon:yes stop_codon:yes gene_type:complete
MNNFNSQNNINSAWEEYENDVDYDQSNYKEPHFLDVLEENSLQENLDSNVIKLLENV